MRTSKFIRFDPMLIEVETYPKHYEITQCILGFGSSSPLAQSRIVVSMFMSAYGRSEKALLRRHVEGHSSGLTLGICSLGASL